MSSPKSPQLQERVLALIEQHISILEEQIKDYMDFMQAGEQEGVKAPKLNMYLSIDLTKYLNTLTDYTESEEKGIGRQLKDLQKLSEEELQKMVDELDDKTHKQRSPQSLSSSKKKK